MTPEQRPKKFDLWANTFEEWDNWLRDNKVSALEACIDFVSKEKRIDKIVIGVSSLEEMQEIIKIYNQNELSFNFLTSESILDTRLLNPSLWESI